MKTEFYNKFKEKLLREDSLSLKDKFRILDSMHSEAVSLGIISYDNIMEGFEKDLKLAKLLNSVRKTSEKII